jgi:acyl-coenzyme A synthetase/AMP-(fatty) acid ligase
MNGYLLGQECVSGTWTADFLDRWAERGERPAMLWVARDGRRCLRTYEHFSHRAKRFANLLGDLGIGAGEPIAVLLPRVPEWWEVAAGALRAGVPLAPIAPGAGLAARVNAVAATALVIDGARLDLAREVRDECPSVRHVICAGGLPAADAVNYRAGIHLADAEHEAVAAPTASVLLTAGDEGTVVAHGDDDLAGVRDRLGAAWLDRRAGDLHWNLTPRHTVAGTVFGLFEPWSAGAAILVDEAGGTGGTARIAALLERLPVTTVSAPAAFFERLTASELRRLRGGALRRVLATDTALHRKTGRAWLREAGLWIHPGPAPAEMPVGCATFPGAY